MMEIDGSYKSGSGTIVRDAVSFSVLTSQEIHLINIRAKREKPGLRRQHLKGMEACQQICQGKSEGAKVGAREVRFRPGRNIKGGKFDWDIGTAGSTTMLAFTVLPLALFASKPSTYKITGGLFQDFAPSVFHLKYVLLPLLRKMGVDADLKIIKPGYVPTGGGIIEIEVNPQKEKLKPITLLEQGKVSDIKGIALSSMLKERRVSQRMAEQCGRELRTKGYEVKIEILYDTRESPVYQEASGQAGASLAIWTKTDTGCLIGSDMAGKLGRSAEFIGREVAKNLIEDLRSDATVDRHLADQLIPFCALAEGESEYLIPRMTAHIETRLWLVEKMLGAKTSVKDNLIRIKGVGLRR
ncbi:RNA 3'-phosphate cyclase [Candidatus Aerophobetes bacterium]|nr:RNA 3'-phosphate cyclase [Candidatus Aerophobetes bacterium]